MKVRESFDGIAVRPRYAGVPLGATLARIGFPGRRDGPPGVSALLADIRVGRSCASRCRKKGVPHGLEMWS